MYQLGNLLPLWRNGGGNTGCRICTRDGFVHTGKPLSFVYDIADIIKFETVVPKAFEIARRNPAEPDRDVRIACRDIFRSGKTLAKLIPLIEDVLAAGKFNRRYLLKIHNP